MFGVKLDLLPVVGYVSPLENFWEGLRYLIMPVTALALIETGVLIRMARSSTIEVLRLEYITHARAKGLVGVHRGASPRAARTRWRRPGP